jgi:hypothetical protein
MTEQDWAELDSLAKYGTFVRRATLAVPLWQFLLACMIGQWVYYGVAALWILAWFAGAWFQIRGYEKRRKQLEEKAIIYVHNGHRGKFL